MKNSKKVLSLSLAATMLGSATTAFAMPADTVVIGDKAFEMAALSSDNAELQAEINAAILDADAIYYNIDGVTEGFLNADGDVAMTTEAQTALKNVVLTKADGTKETFANFTDESGTVVEQADLTAYTAALNTVTEANYTAASWTTYQAVVTANVVTVSNTQAEVDAATAKILEAQKALVSVNGLAVESVTALNIRQIKVMFNGEVDKNTVNKTNVRVYDATTNAQISGITVELAEDNKTAYILNTFTQLKNYKVVVENVASKTNANSKVVKTEKTVQTVDTTLPTAESIAVKSPKTLEIMFSEPIKDFPTTSGVTSKVKIDGINAYFATIDSTKMNTENKVTVTLGTALTVGDHKIVVIGLNDYANLPVAEKEFTVNVAADTTAPTIESVTATTKNKVTVKFNKPVDANTVTKNTEIKLFEGTTQKIIANVTTKDNQTFDLDMTGAELSLASLVDASIKVKDVKDAYGNKIITEQVFKFTATDDLVVPTVSNVKVNTDNTLEVTLSEEVTNFAANSSALELYDKDNKKVVTSLTVASKTINSAPSKTVYTVTIGSASTLSGNYTLKFIKEQIKDNSVRANYLAETTQAISFNDKVAPKYTSATYVNEAGSTDFNTDGDILDSKVTVYFDEAMDASTLTNSANYILNNKTLADVTGASLSAAADNKSVTITVNRTSPSAQLAFTNGIGNGLKLIAVKDAAGNTLDTTQVNQAVTLTGFVSNVTFVTVIDTAKVEVISKNQVKLYAKTGQLIQSIDPNKVKFAKGGVAEANLQVTGVTLAADKKSAVLTLNNNLDANANYAAAALTVYADADAVVTTTGVKTQALAIGSAAIVADKIQPTVQPVDGKFVVTGDLVTLKFDEALTNDGGTVSETAAGLALVVKDSQGTQLTPADYEIAFANSDKDITIKVKKAGFSDKVNVSLSNNVAIKDVKGNYASDFAAVESKEIVTTAAGVTMGVTSETVKGIATVKQVETGTVAIDTAADGTINAIVTAAGMTGSPKTVAVAVLVADDDANKIATKVRAALAGDSDVSAFFDVTGATDKVILTAKVGAANDGTMNLALNKNGTSIITDAASSADTTGGLAAVKEKGTTQVTAGSSNNGTITVNVTDGVINKDVSVAVANGDTAVQVATKIVAALNADGTVNAKYAATVNTDNVVLEQVAGTEADVALAVTIK